MKKRKYGKPDLSRRRKRHAVEVEKMLVREEQVNLISKKIAVGLIVGCSLVIIYVVVFVF